MKSMRVCKTEKKNVVDIKHKRINNSRLTFRAVKMLTLPTNRRIIFVFVCFDTHKVQRKKIHFDLMEHLICDVSNFLYELQNTSNTLKVSFFLRSFFIFHHSNFDVRR